METERRESSRVNTVWGKKARVTSDRQAQFGRMRDGTCVCDMHVCLASDENRDKPSQ